MFLYSKCHWDPPWLSHSPGVPEPQRSNSIPESGLTPKCASGLRKSVCCRHLQLSARPQFGQVRDLLGSGLSAGCRACASINATGLWYDTSNFNSRSKVSSCCMKWKFGAILLFFDRTKLKASFRFSEHLYIRYATVIVTEREIPAKQCTKTPFFFDLASSRKDKIQLNYGLFW